MPVRFVADPLLNRAVDSMARRAGSFPDELFEHDLAGEPPSVRAWFRVILSWACCSTADRQLKTFIVQQNQRGNMIFPTVPITSWPM